MIIYSVSIRRINISMYDFRLDYGQKIPYCITDEAEYLRDNPGHKTNENLKYTYVLVSGLSDGVNIIPVKLTVMEYKERNRPRLHVAMTTSEIEKMRIIADRQTDSQGIMPGESATSFNVMLAD